jgi:uncharacterized protein YacL
MTPLFTVNLLRVLFVTFCAAIGSLISGELQGRTMPGLLIGLLAGLIIVLIDRLLKGISLRAFSSATYGLLLGLIFANLLAASEVLRFQPETTQWVVRLIVYSTFAYLGMMLAMRSNRDEFSLIIPYVRFTRETMEHESLVLDTSVIIDGRIADLCATGFISRSLIVPRFVLSELQALADSQEPMKRDRGRRGLDILNQLQNSREIELTIHESEPGEGPVDERLVRTAKLLQARLLTNDNALGQVARLQQVPTLNLNDLTRALRPAVAAGDELELQLVKEGREAHQAVGYLPDGSMIVVNHARAKIGTSAKIVVSSALQTTGGRLVFAELQDSTANRS